MVEAASLVAPEAPSAAERKLVVAAVAVALFDRTSSQAAESAYTAAAAAVAVPLTVAESSFAWLLGWGV